MSISRPSEIALPNNAENKTKLERLTKLLNEINTLTDQAVTSGREIMRLIIELLNNGTIEYGFFANYSKAHSRLSNLERASDEVCELDGARQVIDQIGLAISAIQYDENDEEDENALFKNARAFLSEMRYRNGNLDELFFSWLKSKPEPYMIILAMAYEYYHGAQEAQKVADVHYYKLVDYMSEGLFKDGFSNKFYSTINSFIVKKDALYRISQIFTTPLEWAFTSYIFSEISFFYMILTTHRFPANPIRLVGTIQTNDPLEMKNDSLYELKPLDIIALVVEEFGIAKEYFNQLGLSKKIKEQYVYSVEDIHSAGKVALIKRASTDQYHPMEPLTDEETERLMKFCYNLQCFNRDALQSELTNSVFTCEPAATVRVSQAFARRHQLRSSSMTVSTMSLALFGAMKSGQVDIGETLETIYCLKS